MKRTIKGIKCDNPECDWSNMAVKWDDIDKTVAEWLNKPCPKCSQNLLTEDEVERLNKMYFVMSEMESILLEIGNKPDESKVEDIDVASSGDGLMKFSMGGGPDFELTSEKIDMLYMVLSHDKGRDVIKQLLQNKPC